MKNNIFRIASFLTLFVFSITAIGCNGNTPPAQHIVTSTSGGEASSHQITWQDSQQELGPLEVVENPAPVPATDTTGQRQTYLAAGQAAPWAGILLSPEAMAYIISEYQAAFERAGAALDSQRQLDFSRLTLEVGTLRTQLESDRQQCNLAIAGLDRDMDRLTQAHQQYIQAHDGGFWATDFGQVLQWGLVIIGALAVGAVVGYISAVVR